MPRIHVIAAATGLAALALAAPAGAKEVSQVAVCGAGNACTTYDKSDKQDLMVFGYGGDTAEPPGAPAGWYRVRVTVTEPRPGKDVAHPWTVVWVPSKNLLGSRSETNWNWMSVPDDTRAALRIATRDIEPLPARRLPGWADEPVAAQVAEVVEPPARPPAPAANHGSDAPWGWIAGGAAALLLATGIAVRLVRRDGGLPKTV
jgi:hypothetical protein